MNKFSTGFPQVFHSAISALSFPRRILAAAVIVAAIYSVRLAAQPTPWCWDPLTHDCAGNPTPVDAYVVQLAWIHATLYPCTIIVCGLTCDPQDPTCCHPEPSTCISYTRTGWIDQDRVLAPATCSSWDAPTPPLWEVALVSVVAENASGRGPIGPCP